MGREHGRRRRTGGGSGTWEHRASRPVLYAVILVLVARGAQVYSGGVLNIQAWLGPFWFRVFEAFTGFGLALGCEMLMSLAGRSWRNWSRRATEVELTAGLSKVQRKNMVAQARSNARIAFVFMCIGFGASVFAGVWFLFTSGGDIWLDAVVTIVITSVVLFLGVFMESGAEEVTEAALADLDDGMNGALMAAVDRFRRGIHTDTDVRFIAEHLPANRQARFRRAVAKEDTGRYWTGPQIAEGLGIGRDSTELRRLNRQVNELAKEPTNGLRKASNGRTWEIPHRIVQDVWGEAMADYRAMRRIGAPTVQAAEQPQTTDGGATPAATALPS